MWTCALLSLEQAYVTAVHMNPNATKLTENLQGRCWDQEQQSKKLQRPRYGKTTDFSPYIELYLYPYWDMSSPTGDSCVCLPAYPTSIRFSQYRLRHLYPLIHNSSKEIQKKWHRILSKGNQITALETTNLVDLTEGNFVGVTDIEGHQVLWLLVTYLYPDSISLSAGKPKKNGGPPGSVKDSENKRSVRESQGIPQGCLEISDLILFCGCFPPACFGC